MRQALLLTYLTAVFIPMATAAEVRLGPEVPLSTRVETAPAAYLQTSTRTVWNGEEFLTLWLDGRAGTHQPSLYGARFDAQGRLIASIGRIANRTSSYDIATAGGDSLLAYYGDSGLRLQRLNSHGSPLGESFAAPTGTDGRLESNGSTYFLFGSGTSHRHTAAILDREGRLLRRIEVPEYQQAIAHDGKYFLFDVSSKLTLTTVSGLGDVLGSKEIAIGSAGINIDYLGRAAAAPDRALIPWVGPLGTGFLIVGFDGALISAPVKIPEYVDQLTGAWDGIEFALFSSNPTSLRARRIAPDGVLIDPTPFTVSSTGGNSFAAASNGWRQLLTWGDQRLSSQSDVVALAPAGFDELVTAPRFPTLVSTSGRPQIGVRGARAGGRLLSVWNDDARLDGAFDGKPLAIHTATGFDPVVAAGNHAFLVAWMGPRGQILVKRVSFDGAILDDQPLAVAATNTCCPENGASRLGVAHDGAATFLITFEVGPDLSTTPATGWTVRGVRVREDGSVVDAKPLLLAKPPGIWGGTPRPAWTGMNFLLAYPFYPFPLPYGIGVVSVNLGTLVAETKLPMFSEESRYGLSMAAPVLTGDRVTLAWRSNYDNQTISVGQSTLGAEPAGNSRTVVSASQANKAPEPALAWIGAELLLVWAQDDDTIRGLRLTSGAVPIDAQPFIIAADVPVLASPSAIATPEGFLIFYSRPDDANGGAPRAVMRSLDRIDRPPHRRAVGR